MVDQQDDVRRIRERGLLGFAEVVEAQCARLLDLAEHGADAADPGWLDVLDARASLSVLLNALQDADPERMPPLGQLLLMFGLDRVEITLITVLWGLGASEALARRARSLELTWSAHLDADHVAEELDGYPAALVARLAFPDPTSQQLVLRALRPQARLRQLLLVRLADGQPRDPRRERIELDPDVAATLVGIWRPPPVGAGVVRVRNHLVPEDIDLYPEHVEHRTRLRSALAARQARVAVIGRPGAGKRTLVRAAAHSEGRGLIELSLQHAPTDPTRLTDLLIRCQRDALLRKAVLYIELTDATLPDAVERVFDDEPGHLFLGVPAERPDRAAAALRASWPDLGVVAVSDIEPYLQPALWAQILARHGADAPPRAELEAYACRPGLVLGELARAAATALAPGSVHQGPEALARALGAALTASLTRELATLAEALWLPGPPGASDAAVDAAAPGPAALAGLWSDYAEDIRGGVVQLSAWGVPEQQQFPRPLVAHAAGDDVGRLVERARALAASVRMPLYRVDLSYLLATPGDDPGLYFDRLFGTAARAGAMLLITPIDALSPDRPWTRSLANALAEHLDSPLLPVLLHGTAQMLPIALESRIQHYLDAPA